MQRFVLLIFCLLQISSGIHGEGHYTVIGPGTLHAERKYHVAVAVHETTKPSKLKVGIEGPSYNETKVVELESPDEVQLVEFNVPDLGVGNYYLTAEGVEGIIFRNSTQVTREVVHPDIEIQTDKGIYKPGETVLIRVLFFDENLKPATILKSPMLFIENPKKLRVKEFKDLKVVKGVYTGWFEISKYPLLGQWKIGLQTGGYHTKYVSFTVDKYVLPRFDVKVEATDRVSIKDGDIQVIVRSNYTYGKPVNGKVTLLLEPRSFNVNTRKIILTADMVNGKSKSHLNLNDYEVKLQSDYSTYLHVTATVEEEFTGVKFNGTSRVMVYPNRYFIYCTSPASCFSYKPGKEKQLTFKITRVDGADVKDTKSPVHLTLVETVTNRTWLDHSKFEKEALNLPAPENLQRFEYETHVNDEGRAVFNVTLPDLDEYEGYDHFFEMTIECSGDVNQQYRLLPYHESKRKKEPSYEVQQPKDYFKIDVKRDTKKYSIDVGQEYEVVLNSSRPISYFVYTIVGRGDVLHLERVELNEPSSITNFTITPTLMMAPYFTIYAFYVDNGDFYYSEKSISVDWYFENEISIEAPAMVKPGEEVQFQICTEPDSFVGLVGVDQSVLMLKDSNELNQEYLRWRLSSYYTITPNQGGYTKYPGDASGVVTLTGANYYYNRTSPWGECCGGTGVLPLSHFGGNDHVANEGTRVGSDSVTKDQGPIKVRSNFVETWIFENIENTEAANFSWTRKIPDTITTWVVSGFSFHKDKGFATTVEKTKIKGFLPFFLSIVLPYAVKRGEIISVPVLVSNYLDKDLDVEVTLENTDDEYEFAEEISNEDIDVSKRLKRVLVPSNSAEGVTFALRPKVIGQIMLKFTAISPLAGDAVHKTLKVIPEGLTKYENRAFLVNLKDVSEMEQTLDLNIPEGYVPDSDYAEFSMIGDILGPILNNMDRFLRLPTGCGEQTMSKFVPNYLMLKYLKSTNRLTPHLEARIKRNLEQGYQNILRYRHKDGSFSSFGPTLLPGDEKQSRQGSTWLTAYVIRFLMLAQEYLPIGGEILTNGFNYLAGTQAKNGSFIEYGDRFYASQMDEITLTSTVLLTLMNPYKNPLQDYTDNTLKGFEFISTNIPKTNNLLAKAMGVYAMQKFALTDAKKHLDDLRMRAQSDDDYMWWSSEEEKKDLHRHFPWRWISSDEVETTSYVLLSLLEEENVEMEMVILPIVKWLMAQRNNYGGFRSSQDTVVGLQALIKFAEKSGYEAAAMDVDVQTEGGERVKSETVHMLEKNALRLQTIELPAKTRSVSYKAKGKGAALMQLSYQYNVLEEEPESFKLNTVVNTHEKRLELDVCVEYVGANGESNMAIVEVALPSGYVILPDNIDDLRKVDRVRYVETKNDETTVVVYFESLRKDDTKCLLFESILTYDVTNHKPSPVVVYDYYDTTKKALGTYEIAPKKDL